jgi:hypothetical protein
LEARWGSEVVGEPLGEHQPLLERTAGERTTGMNSSHPLLEPSLHWVLKREQPRHWQESRRKKKNSLVVSFVVVVVVVESSKMKRSVKSMLLLLLRWKLMMFHEVLRLELVERSKLLKAELKLTMG